MKTSEKLAMSQIGDVIMSYNVCVYIMEYSGMSGVS